MQTANILVALGGDQNNTVPKSHVTAAEIAVLQAIHGADAIIDVEPVGDVEVSARDERERLEGVYGRAKDQNGNTIIGLVYPGAAARLFQNLDELNLVPEQYKARTRVTPRDVPVPDPVEEKPKRGRKAKAKAAPVEPEPAPEEDDVEDDVDGESDDVLG